MSNLSLAGTGWAVMIVMWILKYFNLEADEGTVTGVIESALTVAGFVAALYGQLRRKDLTFGLIRK